MRSSRQSESKQQKQQHCELYSSFDFLTNHLAVDDYSYDVCRQPLLTQLDLLFRECARQLRSVTVWIARSTLVVVQKAAKRRKNNSPGRQPWVHMEQAIEPRSGDIIFMPPFFRAGSITRHFPKPEGNQRTHARGSPARNHAGTVCPKNFANTQSAIIFPRWTMRTPLGIGGPLTVII